MIHVENALTTIASPDFPLHYPIKFLLTAEITYITSTLLLNLSLKTQAGFIISVLAINRLTLPLFKAIFSPFLKYSLMSLIGRVVHLAASIILSQAVCYLFHIRLSFKQICALGTLYCISLYITHFVYEKIVQLKEYQPMN